MINPTRGSVFLGAIALGVTFLFYFQPTVEAVTLANNSQINLEQINQTINQELNNQQEIQKEPIQVQDTDDNLDTKTEKAMESSDYRATAYCLQGKTATGGSVRRGIVAADPRVLPLGTRIQVNAGSYSGTYTVADTGGGVRGRKLDIWVPSCSEARRFGRRSITVSKLGRKS